MKGNDRYRIDGVACRLGERLLKVVNLSVGGFFVETDQPPAPGLAMNFDLVLPGRQGVRLAGLVAWINEPGAPRARELPPGFGVRIVRISFPDKMALLALLREIDPSALRRP